MMMMILFWVVWSMMIILSHSTSVATLNDNASVVPKSIFILAGQSNMAGRGGVVHVNWSGGGHEVWDGYVPSGSRSNPGRVLRLTAALSWEEANEPLHRDIDYNKTCGVGPGMAFANSVLQREPRIGPIGLVPCAVGGTKIIDWEKGSKLYNQLLKRARAGLRGPGRTLRAILWYQGESDTNNFEDAKSYENRLKRFFRDVRSDLESPNLPLIQVALASGEGVYVKEIRKAQMGIVLRNVKYVDAKGLQLEPDKLHLTAASQVELGRDMADIFIAFSSPLAAQINGAAAEGLLSFYLNLIFLIIICLI